MAAQTPRQAGAFTPFLSQQLPGGSEILDRNLLALQRAIGEVVDNFNRTVTFIGVGGGGSAGPYVPTTRLVNTAAPLTGGGPLSADLTLALAIDGTLQVSGGNLGVVPLSGDVVTAGANVATIQPHVVSYGKMQQEGASTLLGNPTGGLADVREVPVHTPLAFVNWGGGPELTLPGVVITGGLSSQNLGSLSSGLLKQSVSLGTATIGVATIGPGVNYSGSTLRLGSVASPAQSTIAEFADGAPSAAAAANMQAAYLWDLINITLTGTTHVTGNGLALASFAGPNITDASAVTVDFASTLAVTGPPTAGGSVTLTNPISFWVQAGRTQLDGALAVNGVTPPANVNLILGHSTETDRDRAQFFLGAGTLGPTGTGDSTLFDLVPSNTSLNSKAVRSPAIYATQRIRTLTYTGGLLADAVGVAASLYIDDAPSLQFVGGPRYAIYVASGSVQVGGAISAGSLAAGIPGTTTFTADAGTNAISFFGVTHVNQQSGGAATAGAAYTATEQGMINRMYSALRNYGLLS